MLMAFFSRREFGKVVMAAWPVASAFRPSGVRATRGLVVGVSGASLRDLPRVTGRDNVDDVIRVMQEVRAQSIELALANIEPAPPSTAPFMAGTPAYPQRVVLSPEQVAATNASARAALRTWREQSSAATCVEAARKLTDGGVTVPACSVAYNDSFTDAEVDATFVHARAFGAGAISSPLTMEMAVRLVPFVNRHQIRVAIHNQVDGNAAGEIATPQLKEALSLSTMFGLKLDIGNVTASNGDAVGVLRQHRSRVAYVLVKDRLRNGGASQPFGEGDTPIAAVIDELKTPAAPVPVFVDYDYIGLRPIADEIRASLGYVTRRA